MTFSEKIYYLCGFVVFSVRQSGRNHITNNIKYKIIMKKFFENPVGEGYSSPAIEVIELIVEGSICNVASADPADWEGGAENWFEG